MKSYRLVFREVDRDKFNEVDEGLKTIETRAATTKYKNVEVGDKLTFVCGKDELVKKVLKVEHFNGLQEMFEALPRTKILPSTNSYEEAEKVYYSFPGYKEKIKKEGIMAFSLD